MEELAKGKHIKAVAGGFPGQLRGDEGEVVLATNLPDWTGLHLRARIKDVFDCPVHIANDVAMCGLGEAVAGAGIAKGVMAYYTVSTGVNASRIVDGKVDATIPRFELGYQIAGAVNGRAVSLESLAGGAALERRLGKPPHEVHDRAVWAQIEQYVAVGLYNAILYWNPAVVVLGGKMMTDLRLAGIAAELEKLPQVMEEWPELRAAKLADEAGLRGALAWLGQMGYK
jgi:predicted NBD/HSP70 family sugar kinase